MLKTKNVLKQTLHPPSLNFMGLGLSLLEGPGDMLNEGTSLKPYASTNYHLSNNCLIRDSYHVALNHLVQKPLINFVSSLFLHNA